MNIFFDVLENVKPVFTHTQKLQIYDEKVDLKPGV
jgi:hypothetical protein